MKKIKLTQGKYALVDDADFETVSKYKWYAQNMGTGQPLWYAARSTWKNGKKGIIKMHRFIMGFPSSSLDIDHIDQNGLNNQKSNLRVVSHLQNMANGRTSRSNTSGFKGVSFNGHKWVAQSKDRGVQNYLGSFENKIDAAIIYDMFVLLRHGEFAQTNILKAIH